MNLSIQARSVPLTLLFRLDWILLSVAAIVQIITELVEPGSSLFWINILGTIVFGAMRYIVPDRRIDKLLYTATEFALLLILTFVCHFELPLLLWFVLTIRNCILLSGQDVVQERWHWVVTILAFAVCLCSQIYDLWVEEMFTRIPIAEISSLLIEFSISLGLVFLMIQLLIDTAISEQKGRERLTIANTQLCQYALQVDRLAIVQERNRIARDIHDSLGHTLVVFNIHIAAALRLIHVDLPEAESLLVEASQLSARALDDVRQSVAVLREDSLQKRSLSEAIESLVADFQRTTSIIPTWMLKIDRPLSTELSYTLYRLIQESLNNIYKHASATEVSICVQQTATEIQAIVQDNGKGFDLHHYPAGFGIQGMQERAWELLGDLKVKTAIGRGCQIQAIFPYQESR